jgi:acyl carrier protein
LETAQLKREIRFFVVENFLYGQDDGLKDDVSLLANGLIDSTGVLELVSFVEDRYGISVKDKDLIPDNFDSIDNLLKFIMTKKNNGAHQD